MSCGARVYGHAIAWDAQSRQRHLYIPQAFLHVGRQVWSEQERADFKRATEYYKGEARELYCASASLDRSFIQKAPSQEVVNALTNLGLRPSHRQVEADKVSLACSTKGRCAASRARVQVSPESRELRLVVLLLNPLDRCIGFCGACVD